MNGKPPGKIWRELGKGLFAALFLIAGIGHFTSTGFFQKIVPTLPFPKEIVLLSGAVEIALGMLLLIPKTSRLAAWGLIALLIAVFPANLYMYTHQELFPLPRIVHILRPPLQAVLILWAYVYTRSPRVLTP